MSTPTLADGLPIWEGQAVRFGSPGRDRHGVFYVHGMEAGKVHLGFDHFADPSALVCELGHRPTFLEAAARIAQARPLDDGGWQISADENGICVWYSPVNDPGYEFGDMEAFRIHFDNPAALMALWQEVFHGHV